ncbi:MAG: serine protease [Patescibacteria group bacterium]
MFSSKRKIVSFVLLAAAGGFLASALAVPLSVRLNFLGTAELLNKLIKPGEITTKIEQRTIVAPQTDYFKEAIEKTKNSIVAIQSFKEGRLLRSGSGLVLTQDGLIATVNSVVPTEANVFQVTNQGKILKAKVVFREFTNNLAIISVSAANFRVVRFGPDLPELGKNLLIFAKVVDFGKDTSLVAPALVSRVNEEKKTFKISADYDINLYGAGLIDNEGTVPALVSFRNAKPNLIPAIVINSALNDYLGKITGGKTSR